MRKTMRIIWLVVAFVALFPFIVLLEAWWLVRCIKASWRTERSMTRGFVYWMQWLKDGIAQNKDFVINGL